jgi:hypothetical protein
MSDTRVRIARVVVGYPDTRPELKAVAGVIDEVNRSVRADRGEARNKCLKPMRFRLDEDGPQD